MLQMKINIIFLRKWGAKAIVLQIYKKHDVIDKTFWIDNKSFFNGSLEGSY